MSPSVSSIPVASGRQETSATTPASDACHLDNAVLLTLVYSDLFAYPLDEDELYRYLVAPSPDHGPFREALTRRLAHDVSEVDGFYCLRGRESIVTQRIERRALAQARWQKAQRFTGWLRHVPFLRMVAVCGSQAVENGDEEGDIDLFLITAPDRLWLVQSITMVLRRLAGLRYRVHLCPNYLLTEDDLHVADHNLYAAREAAQAVPLWGGAAYDRFLDANRWIHDFLPQIDLADRRRYLGDRPQSRLAQIFERVLDGPVGRVLDASIHGLLKVYYALRLRRHGWSKREVDAAYRRDRQVVITGGYFGAVAQRFEERALEVLGDEAEQAVRAAFHGGSAAVEVAADPLYVGIFATRYGDAHD